MDQNQTEHNHNEQTVAEYFGEENLKAVRQRLEEFFQTQVGFMFIATPNGKGGYKVTDLYKGVCKNCVGTMVAQMLKDADEHGLLAAPQTC